MLNCRCMLPCAALPVLLVLWVGCASKHDRIAHPGTIEQQRLRATIHDPYPDPDLGPPIDEARPREYQSPLPEPVRNRIYADSWWWRR
jgi:hypothetical protein